MPIRSSDLVQMQNALQSTEKSFALFNKQWIIQGDPTTNNATAPPQRIWALQLSSWAKPSVQGWKWRPSVQQDPTIFTQCWETQSDGCVCAQPGTQCTHALTGSQMSTKPAQRDSLNWKRQGLTGNLPSWAAVELSSCPIKHPHRDEPLSGRHKS